MQTRTPGTNGPVVSALGLGCMGMSWSYGGPPKDKADMIALSGGDGKEKRVFNEPR